MKKATIKFELPNVIGHATVDMQSQYDGYQWQNYHPDETVFTPGGEISGVFVRYDIGANLVILKPFHF